MRRCRHCQIEKPLARFTKNTRCANGVSWQCKDCRAAYQRQYDILNKDKVQERKKRWRELNADNSSAYQADYYRKHRDKMRARFRAYSIANPEKIKAQRLWSRFKLSIEDYEEIKARQKGLCAICEKSRPLVVDHDHDTKEVRGLLCGNCNKGIGLLGDHLDCLLAAVSYLKTSNKLKAVA